MTTSTSTIRAARSTARDACRRAGLAGLAALSAALICGGAAAQTVMPGALPGGADTATLRGVEESLNTRVDDVSRKSYGGIAAALAVQMPGSHVPGKTVMRVGSAVFRGESAIGLSFRRTSENNGWSLTGGIGVSRAGAAATVGAEWVFD